MSLLHDPFDLIKTGKEMDNIKPFIAQNKIDAMVGIALAHPQLKTQRPKHIPLWKFSGLAAIACMVLFMVFVSPPSSPLLPQDHMNISQISADEAAEFSELVMLDTWERY